jgi:hypothetical protein
LSQKKYCEWIDLYNKNQRGERVFAYELYHWLRIIVGDEMGINAEIHKVFKDEKKLPDAMSISPLLFTNLGQEILNLINLTQNRFAPDLVIHHHNQQDYDWSKQKAVIEIKTNRVGNIGDQASNKETLETILKLNHFLQYINFQYGIFISVNSDFELFREQLRYLLRLDKMNLYESLEIQNRFNRIIIMNYKFEGEESHFHAQALTDILENRDNSISIILNQDEREYF